MNDSLLRNLTSPVLLRGDDRAAYRDPTAVYADGYFHLFFTLVETEAPGNWPFMYTAVSVSRDLQDWSPPRKLTPRDRRLNFSSPGNVVRFDGEWVLCLQTYCRPNGEKYGNADSRLWTMSSGDLSTWGAPKLLRVKGSDVAAADMGRMIDPYLVADLSHPGKWWCLFKQNGVSRAWSQDLVNWTFAGSCGGGENVCVLRDEDEYVLFDSLPNGIGVRRSNDLQQWTPTSVLTLGQDQWPWARGRITAAFVMDARGIQRVGKYLMFFHASGPEDERTHFDTHASIGIAWSDDLVRWGWPNS